MNLHVIAGLPRSGSTLVANAIAQHPDAYVSGTSPLPAILDAATTVLSNNAEVVSMLANVPGSEDAFASAFRGLVEGWYATREERVVVDKSRGWAAKALLLVQLYPDAKIIVTVRDPRDVLASIERQHRATALFDSPLGPTMFDAADAALSPEGMIGGPIRFVEDLVRRNLPNVLWVKYETLLRNPGEMIGGIYEELGLDGDPDVENVENQASDLDAVYRNKYLHDASGPIKSTGTHWSDVLHDGLARLVIDRYPFYAETFQYGPDDEAAPQLRSPGNRQQRRREKAR